MVNFKQTRGSHPANIDVFETRNDAGARMFAVHFTAGGSGNHLDMTSFFNTNDLPGRLHAYEKSTRERSGRDRGHGDTTSSQEWPGVEEWFTAPENEPAEPRQSAQQTKRRRKSCQSERRGENRTINLRKMRGIGARVQI